MTDQRNEDYALAGKPTRLRDMPVRSRVWPMVNALWHGDPLIVNAVISGTIEFKDRGVCLYTTVGPAYGPERRDWMRLPITSVEDDDNPFKGWLVLTPEDGQAVTLDLSEPPHTAEDQA